LISKLIVFACSLSLLPACPPRFDPDALRHRDWALASIVVLALAVRVVGLAFCLPLSQCRPDESTIGAVATAFYRGQQSPHFFNYPPLFMRVVAAVLRAWLEIGQRLQYLPTKAAVEALIGTTTLHFIARLLSAAAGTATVWLLYRIAGRLFGRRAALAAAFYLAVAFLHVRDSHFGVTDVAATFMALAAFGLIVAFDTTPRLSIIVAAGVASGAAMATKYNVAPIAVPALLSLAVPAQTQPPARRLGRVLVFFAAMSVTFVCIAPYSVIDRGEFLNALRFESVHLVAGHGRTVGRGWYVHLARNLRFGLGLPMLIAGLAGLPWLVRRQPRLGLVLASFPVAYFAVIAAAYTVFARYALPLVPFLCMFAGYATTQLIDAWVPGHGPANRRVALWIAVALIAAPSFVSTMMFDRLISRTDTREIAREWLGRAFPDGTTVVQIGPESSHLFLEGDPEAIRHFAVSRQPAAERHADVVIVPDSPIFASPLLDAPSEAAMNRDFKLIAEFTSAPPSTDRVYDVQDEFYLPLTGFAGVIRPGPNYRIYVRKNPP
jgi:4-amino-4-deoxy-L-arabinose transferase-like glycosyltransferase